MYRIVPLYIFIQLSIEIIPKHFKLIAGYLVMFKRAMSFENLIFAYAKTKAQISCTYAFALQIVQSIFFLNLKFQASSHLRNEAYIDILLNQNRLEILHEDVCWPKPSVLL